MKNQKFKFMKKLKIKLQNLNQHPEKVIKTTKFLIIIGCVLILISAVRAILGKTYSYGVIDFWLYNTTSNHDSVPPIRIAGIINLIIVFIILLRNFSMKSSQSKFGKYGLEFYIFGILSMIFGNLFSLPIIFIGIVLMMIFQEEIPNDKEEYGYSFLESLKIYVILNRISVIAVIPSIIGILLYFNIFMRNIYAIMFPFVIFSLILAYYERRNNPNGCQTLALILGYAYFVLMLFDFLAFAFTPGRI